MGSTGRVEGPQPLSEDGSSAISPGTQELLCGIDEANAMSARNTMSTKKAAMRSRVVSRGSE